MGESQAKIKRFILIVAYFLGKKIESQPGGFYFSEKSYLYSTYPHDLWMRILKKLFK